MPAYTQQTWVDNDVTKPVSAARLGYMEQGIDRASIQTVSSLPGSPFDGQEVYYVADATNGIKWHLIYRSASASSYKWEFVGGPPLYAIIATLETSSTNTYLDLATNGPQITLPLGGDYEVDFGAQHFNATAGNDAFVTPKFGAAATADADGFTTRATNRAAGMKKVVKTGLAASAVVKLQYRVSGGTQGTWFDRWLSIKPVRVA